MAISVMSACMSVCLSVCLSADISPKPNAQISPNFLYVLPVAVQLGPLTAMQYVIYFRFCGSRQFFYTMERIGQNQRRRICFVQFSRWRQQGTAGDAIIET